MGVLSQVDEVFIQTIRDWGLYDKIWQAFAVFLPVRCRLLAVCACMPVRVCVCACVWVCVCVACWPSMC